MSRVPTKSALYKRIAYNLTVTLNIPHKFRVQRWKGTAGAHCPVVFDHVPTLGKELKSIVGLHCHVIKNRNRNNSINYVKNLGYDR